MRLLKEVDPEGVSARKKKSFIRRNYSNKVVSHFQ